MVALLNILEQGDHIVSSSKLYGGTLTMFGVNFRKLGIRSDEAAKIASDAGLDVVQDRCVKIEHARIMGGLNWAGVNTGVISARRPHA